MLGDQNLKGSLVMILQVIGAGGSELKGSLVTVSKLSQRHSNDTVHTVYWLTQQVANCTLQEISQLKHYYRKHYLIDW